MSIKKVVSNGCWVVGILLWSYFSTTGIFCAENDIASAEKLFLEGRYERTADETERLIDARSRSRDELYYLKGLSELKLNRFRDARKSFGDIISRYPSSKMVFDAHLGIGDSYFLEGDTTSAAKIYNEMLEKFPNDRNISIVRQRIKNCHASGIPDNKTQYVPDKLAVQVGSFKNKRNAEGLARKLVSEGYESYVDSPLGSADKLYRVKVGRTKSRDEAEVLAAKLKRAGYNTKICTDNICR